MKDWKRIVLVIFVLLGGAVSFGFWSLQEFNNVFNDLGALYVANFSEKISTSAPVVQDESQDKNIDPNFQLAFQPKKDGVYIGCTYEISWLASTTIKSLRVALVDAGTREPAGPVASGLAKENNIEADSQKLMWEVGVVWPGEYFIKISNVNDIVINENSQRFMINEMPSGLGVEERQNICETTDGVL